MGLRARKKERLRTAISDAAIGLFLARGFDAVSVADVAAAAEVSRPTVFAYFPVKEDLVLHRLADHEDEASRVVLGRGEHETPLAALRRHFLTQLEARDAVSGLSDRPEVLALYRLMLATPSLAARLLTYIARGEELLAGALLEVGGDELTARLVATQVLAVQRTLADENTRQIAAGRTGDDVYPEAVRAAERGFAQLSEGIGAPFA
jgi:AcrR family transcriptional regulator